MAVHVLRRAAVDVFHRLVLKVHFLIYWLAKCECLEKRRVLSALGRNLCFSGHVLELKNLFVFDGLRKSKRAAYRAFSFASKA